MHHGLSHYKKLGPLTKIKPIISLDNGLSKANKTHIKNIKVMYITFMPMKFNSLDAYDETKQ
ncbi:hypothetical protein AB835_12525 [Candidatus Endobugula sertula]|uniref:Uncharacterized protein n=1 Tax=Candidatus Endobugula sertula TaxID=62101 RepID=A0A1D2QME6_9GAMM|nr:hypothetical protein AB835_12525 [Candidatus Endobugula sertula]